MNLETLFTEINTDTKALEEKKENARKVFGQNLLNNILADIKAPKMLKEIISTCKTDGVSFTKEEVSSDYMPDHGYYVVLTSSISEGKEVAILTTQQSESWDEFGEPDFDVIMDNSIDNLECLEDCLPLEHIYTDEDIAEVMEYADTLLTKEMVSNIHFDLLANI